eukprot:scaffold5895_cov116-Isochrysis_galbana.AAC.3
MVGAPSGCERLAPAHAARSEVCRCLQLMVADGWPQCFAKLLEALAGECDGTLYLYYKAHLSLSRKGKTNIAVEFLFLEVAISDELHNAQLNLNDLSRKK